MKGDMGHGLINPATGADNTEPVFQIPVGLPSLERGRRVKKTERPSKLFARGGFFKHPGHELSSS